MTRRLIIEADGGSRGNPGLAGSGAVVIDEDTGAILAEISIFIGVATNNVAEYRALIAALIESSRIDASANLLVRMDSKLVIEQMAGTWKIKHPDMLSLAIEAHAALGPRNAVWQWIPREQNSRADALANKAMDQQSDDLVVPRIVSTSVATEFNPGAPSSVRSPVVVSEPATTFYLIRHGRTELTQERRISGGQGPDPDLSVAGRNDASAAGSEVAKIGKKGTFAHLPAPVAVIASPMNRTRQTAETIAASLGVSLEILEELREISFGDWDGFTSDEVTERWPVEFAAWKGSWEIAPPNGESLADFDLRVQAVKAKILSKYAGKAVVVVSHVMPIRGFIHDALEAGVSSYWRTQISPCSISAIRFWGNQEAEVQVINFTNHLA